MMPSGNPLHGFSIQPSESWYILIVYISGDPDDYDCVAIDGGELYDYDCTDDNKYICECVSKLNVVHIG